MLLETPAHPHHVIVDPARLLPRYWATAWSLTLQARGLSKNTFKLRLRHVDHFYLFCDSTFGCDALDDAISRRDAATVARMLEAYFHELSGTPDYNTTAVQRWDVVRGFIQHHARLRATSDFAWSSLSTFLHGMGRMRMPLKGRVRFVRALPAETVADLLEKAHPDSGSNPFKGGGKVRNWLALNLMLLAGLRRGEVLILSVNSLKREFDPRRGQMRYYLLVEDNYDYDPRSATPSIKTERSYRQVPVSKGLVDLWDLYVQEHRVGSDDHSFLLTSRHAAPWAAESLTGMMAQLSKSLTQDALDRFFNRSGGKETVTAHDLRHTCATVRYRQLIGQSGASQELALQQMRAFFGWSFNSKMPELYARSAIEDDLAERWDTLFDTRLELLRQLAK